MHKIAASKNKRNFFTLKNKTFTNLIANLKKTIWRYFNRIWRKVPSLLPCYC